MTFKERVRGLLSCAQAAKRQKTKLDFKTHELAFLVPHAKKNASRVLGLFCLLILGSALSLPGPAITGLIIHFRSSTISRRVMSFHGLTR
jgi:hypothetical protein